MRLLYKFIQAQNGAMILGITILYGAPVLAAGGDGGDEFSNNLLSDLAPLIALFGEQVAKQYLSQSMHWLERVIFACAPLGMITALTCAIRVVGNRTLRAVIGSAMEPEVQAEIEVMSSNSSDVCELWNGVGIVRVAGSPDIVELLYHRGLLGMIGPILLICGFIDVKACWNVRKPMESLYKIFRCFRKMMNRLWRAENQAPNISLNTTNPAVDQTGLWIVDFIGIVLQGGVLAFDGAALYYWKWDKGGTPVAAYGCWLTSIGTLAVVSGMFICAYVIELSTKECVWKAKDNI